MRGDKNIGKEERLRREAKRSAFSLVFGVEGVLWGSKEKRRRSKGKGGEHKRKKGGIQARCEKKR